MARQRLGVVLLVPQPLATQIDGLRRALGDDAYGRIPPHITLVPPVNVAERDLPSSFASVRFAAATTTPLELVVGPVSTFRPSNPVAYLEVAAAEEHMVALNALRRGCLSGPLDRPQEHEFVPHVTIASELSAARQDAVGAALPDFTVDITIERVHVLAEQPGRVWVPIADMPLGVPTSVVGRGSLPLDLSVSGRPDLEAASLLAIDGDPSGLPFAITARRDGAVVAVAWGWTASGHLEMADLVVGAAHRGQGVGRHLVAAVEDLGRRRTCTRAGTMAPADGSPASLLGACGWALVSGTPVADGGPAAAGPTAGRRRWERTLVVDG